MENLHKLLLEQITKTEELNQKIEDLNKKLELKDGIIQELLMLINK